MGNLLFYTFALVGELLPAASITSRGVLEQKTYGGGGNNGMKNIKLFRGVSGSQYFLMLRVYYANTNNTFAIQCNNGTFIIDKLTTGNFPLKFKVLSSDLYLTLDTLPVATVSLSYFSIGTINNTVYMEGNSTDLSGASNVSIL